MTSRGPFRPKAFYDSMILYSPGACADDYQTLSTFTPMHQISLNFITLFLSSVCIMLH